MKDSEKKILKLARMIRNHSTLNRYLSDSVPRNWNNVIYAIPVTPGILTSEPSELNRE